MDGEDLNLDLDIEKDLNDKDINGKDFNDSVVKNTQEYNLQHVTSQLEGMVDHWFDLSQSLDASKKEAFLKLGDRLYEIINVIRTEFTDAN